MKNAHFLHVFLAAVICYSQIVATAHDVTHLSTDGLLATQHVSISACGSSTHDSDEHKHLSGHNHDFTHTNRPTSGDESEPDWAIYHAVLNLNGIPNASQAALSVPKPDFVYPTALYAVSSLPSLDNQPIRGPPTYS